jgi:hypothetical protein
MGNTKLRRAAVLVFASAPALADMTKDQAAGGARNAKRGARWRGDVLEWGVFKR